MIQITRFIQYFFFLNRGIGMLIVLSCLILFLNSLFQVLEKPIFIKYKNKKCYISQNPIRTFILYSNLK